MSLKEISKEVEKCKQSPYYFCTKYLKIKNKKNGEVTPFTTFLSEENFNSIIEDYGKQRNYLFRKVKRREK